MRSSVITLWQNPNPSLHNISSTLSPTHNW